jgi:hypothetical protein
VSTVGKLIDKVLGELESWSLDEEQSTTLAAPLDATSLTLTVTTARGIATGITPGILEIDSEMLYADGVDGTNVSVVPWGRGYKSTTAASHAIGARVISQPTFPRAKVLDEMNDVLQRIFPKVWAVKALETTTTYPALSYDLPADAQKVLTARWQLPDGRQYWRTVRRVRMQPGIGSTDDTDNPTAEIADAMIPGRPLEILYTAKPTQMTSEDAEFTTATGLPRGLEDVVVLGAAASMTTSQELSRLQTSSIEQQNRSQLVAPSAALTSSRYLEQRFQQRLAEERRSLQEKFPPRITGTWR